ncbi:MAG: response regulator [Planctomycetes bacterium]|nr:response regulator [Planctomycetota bacterium]
MGHEKLLDELFTQVLTALTEREVVTVERISQDGKRVRASAGSSSFHREATLQRRLKEVQDYVKELKRPPDEPPCAPGRPRVLVVDDDPGVTEVLRIRLESSNYRVICAHGGAAAYWAAMEQKPNIITLDIGMPELDGADLLKKLKSHPLTRGIPVIVLTGNTDQSTKKELLNLGAAAYLTKPFRSSDLLTEIENILAAAGTEAHTDH